MKKTTFFKVVGFFAGILLITGTALAQTQGGFAQTPPIVPPSTTTNTGLSGTTYNGLNYNSSFVDRGLNFLTQLLKAIPPVLVAIAGVVFMFEVVRFIFLNKDGKPEEKDKVKNHILYSLIALVVLLGFWSIVGIISSALGINQGQSIDSRSVPRVNI